MRLKLAREFIAVQNDNRGRQMEVMAEGIINYVKNDTKSTNKDIVRVCPEFKTLMTFVEKEFGLKMRFVASDYTIMACLPMMANKHHVFLHEDLRGFDGIDEQEKHIENWAGKAGTVDLKNAKLGGIFSEYEHSVFINPIIIVQGLTLTAKEIVAVLLHEIGHLFNTYEFANRLSTTNVILANIGKNIKTGNDDIAKLTYWFKEYENATGLPLPKDLLETKDRTVIGKRLFEHYFDSLQSQWPDSRYDDTGSEVSADIFAVQMGYGKDLATALYSIEKTFGSSTDIVKHDAAVFFSELFTIMVPIITVAFSVLSFISGGVLGAIFGVLYGLILVLYFKAVGTGANYTSYDDIKTRYLRIRGQMIQLLKDADLDTKSAQEILNCIYKTDDIIKNTYVHKLTITKISDLLFTKNRSAKNSLELQRQLEMLASNNLFLKAAEFKTA